jgi:hypothetical protein
MLKGEFVPKEMIGAGLVIGLATSLATICVYENTGNLQQGRVDGVVSSVTRIDKDEEQKSWRKSPTASIKRQSEMMDDRPQSDRPTQPTAETNMYQFGSLVPRCSLTLSSSVS